ncbi:MAG: hypothetical protein IJQ81_14950 [Oscillibacter sp.]|nr:hypothetical protein [Oscillibacter sp.]
MMKFSPVQILLAGIVGTTGLMYLFSRAYILLSSLALRLYVGKNDKILLELRSKNADLEMQAKQEEQERAEQEKETHFFHDDFLTEIQKANINLSLALLFSFLLMMALWFFAPDGAQSARAKMMLLLQLISCGAFLTAEITKALTSVILPARLSRRKEVISKQNAHNYALIFIVLYTIGRWIYSL